MHEIHYLRDIVVLFGVAVGVLLLSSRIRVPSVVGFLITGAVVGPYGLGLISDPSRVEQFAVLGVVFLLFIIGLELTSERLRGMGRIILLGGGLQTTGTLLAILGISVALGVSVARGFFFGALVALSSTALVLKLYQDRREMDSPHGKTSLGILLFQDFMIVPFLLLVPLLAGTQEVSTSQLVLRFSVGLVVIGLAFVIGRYLLPHFMHILVKTRIRELFVIGSLFACLLAAFVTEMLGFSLALGAFLAGILIGESEYNAQVAAEITPFRDVFNSMFFISVGMLLQLEFALENWAPILGIAAMILVLKIAITLPSVLALQYPIRTAFLTALGLAQIGEFSFVLAQTGHQTMLLDDRAYQLAIAAAILTMLITPLLIHVAPRLADVLHRVRVASGVLPSRTLSETVEGISNHVIIVGYGLGGQHLERVLRSANSPYLIIELNGVTARKKRRESIPIFFGDATRPEVLLEHGIERAQAIVFLVSDARAARSGVRIAHQLNPDLFILARSQGLYEIEQLQNSGASVVIAQEFESSIEIVSHILDRLHMPRNVIQAQARLLRADGYQMLRSPTRTRGVSDHLLRALEAGTTETFLLTDKLVATGKTIRDLDLRKKTGASIIAVVRSDQPYTNPDPELELEAADILVLVGDHVQMDLAFRYLEHRKDGAPDPLAGGTSSAGPAPEV